MQVLVALAVGCAFGSGATGCAFIFLGTARADTTVTTECKSTGQTVTYALPDDSPETLAGLSVVTTYVCGDGTRTVSVVGNTFAFNGIATAQCDLKAPDKDHHLCTDAPSETISFVSR
jgi:hypothetical protein